LRTLRLKDGGKANMGEHQSNQRMTHFLEWLRLAGNSDDVIDWAKVRARSLAVGALEKRDRCKLLLNVANGGAVSASEYNQLVGMPIARAPDNAKVPLNAARLQLLSSQLTHFLTASKQERLTMFETLRSVADAHTFLGPFDSTKAQRERPLIAENLSAGLVYSLQIIFDPRDEFASKLNRCHFSECNKFFFARPARGGVGRPSTRYCCLEHVKKGVLEQARIRMKRNRK
jgi:hypothetical protein